MKTRYAALATLLVAGLALAISFWFPHRVAEPVVTPAPAFEKPPEAPAAPSAAPGGAPVVSSHPATIATPGGNTTALAPVVSGSTPAPVAESTPIPGALPEAIAIEKMSTTIRHYGSRFNGNPVGTNAEITRALNGANPAHVRFLDDQTDHINSAGELVDQWGTPYFFHQLSGHEMEIRSAGPDRKMYTGDDLISR